MRRWSVLIGLFLGACGDPVPPPRPWVEPSVLFPERPELDVFAPSRPWVTSQETWTGTIQIQHCREWHLLRERADAGAREARAALLRLGLRGGDAPDITRGNGLDVVLTPASYLRMGDPSTSYPKLLVCTTGVATRAARDAFVREMRADALYPSEPPPLGEPYVLWRRHYNGGATQIGAAWEAISGARAREWLDGHGFHESRHDRNLVWMENGLAAARVSDASLWWDRSDRPYP